MGIACWSRNKASKNFRTWKKYTSKRRLIIFGKKLIVMTKFPDNSLTLVKWTKFPDIFSKFPDNSLTWRKFCFSLTFQWYVATLNLVYCTGWVGGCSEQLPPIWSKILLSGGVYGVTSLWSQVLFGEKVCLQSNFHLKPSQIFYCEGFFNPSPGYLAFNVPLSLWLLNGMVLRHVHTARDREREQDWEQ